MSSLNCDYVVIAGKLTHEGWVYYKIDEHITIELGVKDKPVCEIRKEKHKKIHVLLACRSGTDKLKMSLRKDYHIMN